MKFRSVDIDGAILIELEPFEDARGFFSRIFCQREFAAEGLETEFVQINHSITRYRGTIRGLHYQVPPYEEVKLLRCVQGSLVDVIVDIRKSSPTFLKHFKITLSDRNNQMLYIPAGFAHGFQTLEHDTALIYLHSNFYKPTAEHGLKYDDPRLKIEWPLEVSQISSKDNSQHYLTDHFEGIET